MSRYARLRRIERLDPDRDYAEIFRLSTRYEFPWDYNQGIAIAFLRDFGVPSISKLLDRTREFADHGQKRYDDTLLFGFDSVRDGLDSPRGHATVRRLNRIHGHYSIADDDFRYVLATLVVGPVRWINAYGWRPLCSNEIQSYARTNGRLGELMGIRDIPTDYAGFERLLAETERTRFAFDCANRRVAEATLRIFADWFPWPLRSSAARAVVALLDEPLRLALGLSPVSPLLTLTVRAGLRLRGRVVRRFPVRSDARPAVPKPRTYPHGWLLDQLGPSGF
jgi:uncharacterized protein (DUF2236 family)